MYTICTLFVHYMYTIRKALQQCIEQCTAPSQQLQNVLQQHMKGFQDRLMRGMKQCEDEARDTLPMGAQPTMDQQEAAQAKMEGCAALVGRRHLDMLPKMRSDLMGVADQLGQ